MKEYVKSLVARELVRQRLCGFRGPLQRSSGCRWARRCWVAASPHGTSRVISLAVTWVRSREADATVSANCSSQSSRWVEGLQRAPLGRALVLYSVCCVSLQSIGSWLSLHSVQFAPCVSENLLFAGPTSPVLKHGPRSLMCVQVFGCQTRFTKRKQNVDVPSWCSQQAAHDLL